MQFLIQRHGGRSGGYWRVILKTEDSAKAHVAYEEAARAMRRGGVRKLIDGTEACAEWAPRQ